MNQLRSFDSPNFFSSESLSEVAKHNISSSYKVVLNQILFCGDGVDCLGEAITFFEGFLC